MTLDELKGNLIVELGNRPNMDKLIESRAQYIIDFILEGDASFIPWFLLVTDEAFAVTADTQTYDLPAGFISEYEFGFLYNIEGFEVKKETYEIAKERNRQDDEGTQRSGAPTRYAIRNRSISFFPVPNVTGNMSMSYYKKADPLKDSSDHNPWLLYAADWVMNEVGADIAGAKEHYEKAKYFRSKALVARNRIQGKHFEEMTKNMSGLVR